VGVVCLTAVFAGMLPALSATNKGVLGTLQDTSRSVGGGLSRAWLRKALLTTEIALTVVLLVAAGLLLKSFVSLRTTDLGSATDNVLTMGYSLPTNQYSKPEQRVAFAESLLERVRRMPGVQAAGIAYSSHRIIHPTSRDISRMQRRGWQIRDTSTHCRFR
jgi:hypothetical protein